MNNEPVAVFIPGPLRHDEWKRRFILNWIDEEPTVITHLYSEVLVRQQQAEIEALKKLVSEMKYEKSSGVYEMNNEPVAWMKVDEVLEHFKSVGCGTVYKTSGEGRVPLYTHPVELTDEEIISTMVQFDVYSSDDHLLIEAGRAILRKASEK